MAKGHDYLYSDIPETLYVEGLSAGTDTIDLTVTSTDKTFKGITSNSNVTNNGILGNATDAVKAMALVVDLDIDSDNNGTIDGSAWEEELEDNIYGLGKLVRQSTGALPGGTMPATLASFTPAVLRLSPGLDPDDPHLKVRFDYDFDSGAGFVKLWKVPKDHPDWNEGASDLRILKATAYPLSELNYNAETGAIALHVDGIFQSLIRTLKDLDTRGKPDEKIKATILGSGTNNQLSDEVKYIVTSPLSIFWEMQERAEVRSALASDGVYDLDDLPQFSLEKIDG